VASPFPLTVEAACARVRSRNHAVRAVLTPTLAGAEARAAALAKEPPTSPLHGVPYTLKDVWDTAGIPTTGGSWSRRDNVPSLSGPVHAALEAAGAVLIGKSNLSDLALTPESDNLLFGPVTHPLDPARTAGGSSGGAAAAVADGMAAFDWGSDYGGSIRLPAAFCGVVGLRLSASHWPPDGHSGPPPTTLTFNGMGPIARTVEGCRAVVSALSPRLRTKPPSAFEIRGVALVLPDDFSAGVWSTFEADARSLLGAAGFEGVAAARLPSPREIDRTFAWTIATHLFGRGLVSKALNAAASRRPAMHPQTLRIVLELAAARLLIYRDAAEGARRLTQLRAAAEEIWASGRLLVAPTTTFPAPRHGKAQATRGIAAFVKLGNAIDATALALPFGRFADGMPRSLQLLGPPGSEDAVLAAASRLESQVVSG
jgi:Asp-tRNA(Asn)/Glu-tRNA(Gln) amidotransferase A subunit family amidase